MHKYFRNRLFQGVLILVILCGAFLFNRRTHWQSQPAVPSEKVSKPPAVQQAPPADEAAPRPVRPDAQPTVAKRVPVALVPGLVPAAQVPSRLPPATAVTQPSQMSLADKVKAEVERLTEGLDAFTAAKRLEALEPGGGGNYGPYIRAFAAQAYAENPDDVEVVKFWAELQHIPPWHGSNPEAIRAYRKLLELRPDSPDALLGLSEALWTTEPEEALGHLEKLQRTSRFSPWDVELQAKAYQRMGDSKTALEVLKTYREKYPMREPVELSPLLGYSGGPTEIDFQIQAVEEGKPLVEPHPRYLEAPPSNEGIERAPVSPFEKPSVPTEDGTTQELIDKAGPHDSPPADTGDGLSRAEIDRFFRDMTAHELDVFEQFIRDEFPEYAQLLDETSKTPARPRKEMEAEFTPKQFRNAQQTLQKYGLRESLKRLQQTDPQLARQLARELKSRNTSRRQSSRNSTPEQD